MIRAIALDDELPSLEIITHFSSKIPELALINTFQKTKEARSFLENTPVDLIFLDINMPNISGLDFYKTLPQETLVVLTTAYKKYAIESYEIGVFGYLLKPFGFSQFHNVVNRVIHQTKLIKNSTEGYFYIRVDFGLVKINFNEILYIKGQDNYVKFYFLEQKPLLVRMTIKELLTKLPETSFCRIHRSTIVSLPNVKSYKNRFVEVNGQMLSVGNTYIENFLHKLKTLEL